MFRKHALVVGVSGFIAGLIIAAPITGNAYREKYNATHCVDELWSQGTGYLYSDGTLWNVSSTELGNHACPTLAADATYYSDWDLSVFVRDGSQWDNIEARPYNCQTVQNSCTWHQTKGSAGDDVHFTLNWTNLNMYTGGFAGFWVNLPVTEQGTGDRSGLLGYSVRFHN